MTFLYRFGSTYLCTMNLYYLIMKRKLIITFMFLCCLSNCHLLSGQHLTLRESIETGIQRNLSLQNKNLDIKQQTYTVKESRAQLLPIINAFGNFTNNVDRGTSVSDGTSRGIPYVETQGLRYSTNGGVTIVHASLQPNYLHRNLPFPENRRDKPAEL